MKYDILNAFKGYLYNTIENKNTAERYYFATDQLLKGLQFNNLSEIPLEEIEKRLQSSGTKNAFSAAKNGLKHLKEFDYSLILPDDDFLKATSMKKRNYSKKPKKTIYLDTTRRKVNGIHNKKLALAYRLMEKTGARVSEVAALTKGDIEINGDNVTVNILHGKGGSNGTATITDSYLAKQLSVLLEPLQNSCPPFYSASTMKKRAGELGLECHDFRRIAAINYRNARLAEEIPKETANDMARQFLRHARFSTTKRYLFNRKLKFKNLESDEVEL